MRLGQAFYPVVQLGALVVFTGAFIFGTIGYKYDKTDGWTFEGHPPSTESWLAYAATAATILKLKDISQALTSKLSAGNGQ